MRSSEKAKRAFAVAMASAMTVTTAGTVTGIPFGTSKVAKAAGIEALYVDSKDYYNDAYDSTWAYDGNDLGCTYSATKTVFKLWSPEADSVKLNLYATGSDKEDGHEDLGTYDMTKMKDSSGKWNGVWEYTLEGDQKDKYYTYRATIGGETYKEAVDPYAKAVGVNGNRAMVVDLASTNPAGWDKDYKSKQMNLSEAIVWEIDIRDFSISASSGVSEANRGKYKAFTENTTVNAEGKIASCVDYLKKMGVTHVQVLPAFDFDGVDETMLTTTPSDTNYNWGYNPKNYNVPDGSYSTNPYNGNTRITEMKEMIQALHNAGIQVVMDVVYNHTGDTATSNFNKVMPDYYYKLTDSNGKVMYDDQSGCGNATRCSGAMFEKYMVDSLNYWADEYNIDGFRFDLMGIHDWKTMNAIRASLDKNFGKNAILMYGEGWTGGGYDKDTSCYKTYCRNLDPGIGYFNDQIRDAIKGETGPEKVNQIGFAQQNLGLTGKSIDGEKNPTSAFGGIMGSVGKNTSEWWMWRAYWSDTSDRCLSYDSCHDNMTIWDKFTESIGESFNTTSSTALNMSRMAAGYLLTSHGGTFLCGGEEFARTKNGNENSYNSGDTDNAIDWSRISTYANLTSYYQGMIDIRKAFSGFRTVYTETGDVVAENTPTGFFNKVNNNNLTNIESFTDVAESNVNAIGYYLSNDKEGEWNQVAVLMNNTTKDRTAQLSATDGSSQWVLVSDGKQANVEGLATVAADSITIPGKSVVVAVPKNTFDSAKVKAAATAIVANNAEPADPMKSEEVAETTRPVQSSEPTPEATAAPTMLTVTSLTCEQSAKNTDVTFSAQAGAIKGSAQYRFYIYSGDKVVKSTNWTKSNTYTLTGAKEGNYTVVVAVRDDETQVQSKAKTFQVKVEKKLSVQKVSATASVKKGKKVTCKAVVAGGAGDNTYKFKIVSKAGKTIKSSGAIKKATWTWKASKKGTYKVVVTVIDKNKTQITKTGNTIKVK